MSDPAATPLLQVRKLSARYVTARGTRVAQAVSAFSGIPYLCARPCP